jgi:plasmid maintenance system antidote protein VapI
MSVRLAKAMPYTSPEFWLKMQLNYDLWKAQKNRQPKIKPFPARPQKELASTLIRHRRRPIANPELL